MDLGREVLDKQLLDSEQRRCGKVDDLLLAWENDEYPVVKGILSQQGALARDFGKRALAVALWIYRLLGVERPQAVFIDWNLVEKIDVVVHLTKTRHELKLNRLQLTLAKGIIGKIPGAKVR